ncbi:MAG TPA: serine/threonine-protein kinase [Gemmatimonadaceae bacterium]|nr:serine/threonine-protein kinase [Gemmatimonadaceae bacterium]
MDPFRERLAAALAPAYELERELTGGGMSRVFVARERALARLVVVKVLPPDLAAGVNTERFRREIQLAAQLQHPHIVPLLSAGEHEELLYYTMPYIEGESLRTRVEREGALSVRDVVRILHDVVEALAYAHERGVIHRDIKPGNILTLGSHALVTDFGVAKALSAALPHSGTTSAGMVVGSPAYMAPEQLAGDPSADHRVDLYAAGLLAYELLSGTSPFTGTTPQETMAAQLTRIPEPLHQVRDDVPPELSAVIERALRKAPEQRHPTARAMLDELERVTTPRGALLTGAAPARRDPLGRGMRFAAILAVAAVIGVTTLVLVRGEEPPEAASAAAAPDAALAADSTPAADSIVTLGDTTGLTPVSGARAPVVLTYEDSVAIARAMQRRTNTTGPIDPESLKVVFQRALSDSALHVADAIRRQVEGLQAEGWARDLRTRVLVAPQLPPAPATQPRVVIADLVDGTQAQNLGPSLRVLTDSLRTHLSRGTSLEVVDGERTRAVASSVPNHAGVGYTLRADLMVTGHVVRRGDSVVVQALVSDLRRGRVVQASSDPVPPDDALAALPSLLRRLRPRVEAMARASRVPDVRQVEVTPPVAPTPRAPTPPSREPEPARR